MRNEINTKRVAIFIVFTIIQVSLLIIKLLNIVNWSWLWILAPLWMPYVLFVFGASVVIIYVLIDNYIRKVAHGRKLYQHQKPGQRISGKDPESAEKE